MLIENIKLAFASMAANKLRTFLTMLGIIIGITSVIAIMTVGEAQTQSTMKQYMVFGLNNVDLSYGYIEGIDWSKVDSGEIKSPEISKEMLSKMCEQYGDMIEAIGVQSFGGMGRAKVEGDNSDSRYSSIYVGGVNSGFLTAYQKQYTMKAGRSFASGEMSETSNATVISTITAECLFDIEEDGDYDKALGKKVDLAIDNNGSVINRTCTVIGVYEQIDPFSSNDPQDMSMTTPKKDQYTMVFIPYKSSLSIPSEYKSSLNSITVLTKTGTDVLTFADELSGYMNSLIPEKDAELYQFSAYTNKQWIESSADDVRKQTMTFALIGAIALIVGGIGVMNIMTVTITERTREIGTRKALGALSRDIRMQFITEAVILSVTGGIIGMITGISLGLAACVFVNHVDPMVSVPGIFISFLFSLAVGVFFGFYPANKAAKMDPIEALRYE